MVKSTQTSSQHLFILVLLIAWTYYFCYKPQFWPFIWSDGYGYHVWLRHLLNGDLSFCSELSFPKKYSHTFASLHEQTGICSNMYPPGVGLAKLPIALFGNIAKNSDVDPTKYEQYMSLAFALMLLFVTTWLCLKISTILGASASFSQYSVATFTFGSGLFHYSSYFSSFSHVYSAFWSVAALYSLLIGRRIGAAIGVAAGTFLILTRATNIVFFPLLIAFLFIAWTKQHSDSKDFKPMRSILQEKGFYTRVAPLCLGGLLGVLLQVSLNSISFGKLTISSYSASGAFEFGGEQALNTLRVLFSTGNGVVTYQPILVIGIFAALANRSTRHFGTLALIGFLFYLAVYSTWVDWHLGHSFAHRGFVELGPIISIVFALMLTHARLLVQLFSIALSLLAASFTVLLMLSNWSFFLPIIDANFDQLLTAATGTLLRTDQWIMFASSILIWMLCASKALAENLHTLPHLKKQIQSTLNKQHS